MIFMIRQQYFSTARYTQVLLYRKLLLVLKTRVFYVQVSAIKRFYYKDLTVVSSVLAESVLYTEVSAVKNVCYIEAPLY